VDSGCSSCYVSCCHWHSCCSVAVVMVVVVVVVVSSNCFRVLVAVVVQF